MTLLREIQGLFSRTYAGTGVNLEDFVVGDSRQRQLEARAGESVAELSHLARTYLRRTGGQLRVAVYYAGEVIENLEAHPPQNGLSEENIHAFIMFVEEVNHAHHAMLRFLEGHAGPMGEEFIRDLELQSRVDTYLVLLLYSARSRGVSRVGTRQREWLLDCLFGRESFGYSRAQLSHRYREVNRLGLRYVRYLNGLPGPERVGSIRQWRPLDYTGKREFVEGLEA
ncbi:MAG: hypothetical protein SFY92_07475 [Verrucomicrobiae bacterium]|nr:hypothetical protein [Verrucomicrobiae bacterium]